MSFNQTGHTPSFSIVIPSHNRKEQLVQALSNIAQQTYPSGMIEVVVVLDGCTDGSARLLEEKRAFFPFQLHVLEQAQGGPSRARNAGVQAAQGEYILFLDDDVMATPELVMEHWHTHAANPRTVVIGTMSRPPAQARKLRPIWVRWEEYILERQYHDILQGHYQVTARQFYTGNGSLRREWLLEAGLFDESFKRYEDVELAYRLARLELNFQFNPAAIGYHYIQRSFQSWRNVHQLYGRYAVKLEREKGIEDVIAEHIEEFQDRHILTRFLSRVLLHRKTAQCLTTQALLLLAQLASMLKQERLAYHALSCVANVLFWQGFNDELYSDSANSNADSDLNTHRSDPPKTQLSQASRRGTQR
jgi:glycosyltransferase involved in cell wall biosynthesis